MVVPIFQDADLLDDFCLEFETVFSKFLGKQDISEEVELIVVCDGGGRADESTARAICNKFAFMRAILLSRNFGQHIALTAGYNSSRGEAVGMLNVDQQDPISELPKFLMHLAAENLDVVYGIRKKRQGSLMERLTSRYFHLILDKLTDNKTPANISTMRVMSRRFINAYNEFTESQRYLPGLESWLGFDVGYVATLHRNRKKGTSSYTFMRRCKMAVNSILSFSDYPLRLISLVGFLAALTGLASVATIIVMKLCLIDFQAGYPSLISVIVFFSGLVLSSLGFSSLYIGRILREVQRRPTYIVKATINLSRTSLTTK
nr:glycosyltransferase family 2 protein [Rubripirellula sp.]